jgi:hypothetical protein
MRTVVETPVLAPVDPKRRMRPWALVAVAVMVPALASAEPRHPAWPGPPHGGDLLQIVPLSSISLAAAPEPPRPRPAPVGPGHPYHPHYGRWWPGQMLPPDAPATVVTDLARYHVRPAPPGYVWLLCDGDLILAATGTGLITEVLPGGGD